MRAELSGYSAGFAPPHIHVEHGDKLAKFWLAPARRAASPRFKPHELAHLYEMVVVFRQSFIEAWDEHFGSGA